MSRARQIVLLAVLGVLGCNNNNNNAVSFAFNTPERLGFVCLAQYADVPNGDPARNGQWTSLPRECCTIPEFSNLHINDLDPKPDQVYPDLIQRPNKCLGTDAQPLKSAVLHALVTQSTRGEVAAVDLFDNRVLDSDRQIPGFTFLDTGGLPTAIVVPPEQPKREGKSEKGPEFFYVASAEQNEVRAIPTCRFRNGARCGPDRDQANADPAYPDRLRVSLPGAPSDMILGPDDALWVTIPSVQGADGSTRGVIVRIALPDDELAPDAFALDVNTRRPPVPAMYGVPAVNSEPMGEPVLDAVDYVTSCGLGAPYAPASFTLPTAPLAAVRDVAEPQRMRFDEVSGLLFVNDRASPGLHVFRPGANGELISLGSLATGQPLREFVITPTVPTRAVSGLAMIAPTVPAEDRASETKRYLYGIDNDGRVAVFDLVADDNGTELPVLTPLLVPDPDIAVARYADRIELPSPAQTLEVIDTRDQSGYVCGQESVDALRAKRTELRGLPKPLNEDRRHELARVEARISIYEDAANDYVRGVFIAVTSLAGRLSLIDVHDLDSACRAQRFCCESNGSATGVNGVPASCLGENAEENERVLNRARSTDAQESLLVRRHAWRRRAAGPQSAEVGTASLLAPQDCNPGDPLAAVGQLGRVCTPADGYQQLNETWRVDYEGTLPGSYMPFSHWEAGASPNQLALVAPTGTNMCARGVEVGDLVAVLGRPPEGRRGSRCPDPSADAPRLYRIIEANAQRLIVVPFFRDVAADSPALDGLQKDAVADALFCYPDYVGAELRAGGFLVLANLSGIYLHRVITGLDGKCIPDDTLDERLSSRVGPGKITPPMATAQVDAEVFSNPYVSFALQAAPGVLPETRETTVSVQRASIPFYVDLASTNDVVTVALPSALQYLPEAGYLFLLDTSGQGLRRYRLRPFEREDNPIR